MPTQNEQLTLICFISFCFLFRKYQFQPQVVAQSMFPLKTIKCGNSKARNLTIPHQLLSSMKIPPVLYPLVTNLRMTEFLIRE